MEQGFSFATVVLSYFLVGGGMFSGMLIAGLAKVESSYAIYAMMAAGAFVGGFVAARASRGSTVLEPAIGAIALVGTVVGLAAGTEVGKLFWHVAPNETIKFVALIGGVAGGGAIAGAYISEKSFGEATLSSGPWIIYSALATFGACMITTVVGSVLVASGSRGEGSDGDALAKMLLAGLAAGCLIAGIAIGASARSRPVGAAFLGGALGTAGFAFLIAMAATGSSGSGDSTSVIGVFAAGGGILTFLGSAVGWAIIGKKRAG